jgi:hypothetical protein
VASITSVALMITVTGVPGSKFMLSAEARVMADTISEAATSTTTSAITFPILDGLTVSEDWLRALSFIRNSPLSACTSQIEA